MSLKVKNKSFSFSITTKMVVKSDFVFPLGFLTMFANFYCRIVNFIEQKSKEKKRLGNKEVVKETNVVFV